MAIGVEGQFFLIASVEGKRDFIGVNDLTEFTIIEESGNNLPKFDLEFTSPDEELIAILNDGNSILMQLGLDKEELVDISIAPITLNCRRSSETEYTFAVSGILNHLSYVNSSEASSTDKKSGVAALSDLASKHGFKFAGNITSSKDSQNWTQYGISPRRFANELWLHSYVQDSFIGMGITSTSEMVVKDIKKEIQDNNDTPAWRFVKAEKKPNDVAYLNGYAITNNSGMINAWMGNGREMSISSLTDANYNIYGADVKPVMALTKEVIKNKDMTSKFGGSNIQTGSSHDKYWEAYQDNLTNLATLSSFKLTVPCGNRFFPVKILDLVFFKDSSLVNPSESSEYLSGLYLVSKVVRSIKGKSMQTYVDICRESPNLVSNNVS